MRVIYYPYCTLVSRDVIHAFKNYQNEQEQSFQVRAVGDGLPELFEAFAITLVSADGGGRIADPREARIAIQASDDPSGLIGFEGSPGGIVISEGDQLMVRCVKRGIPMSKLHYSMMYIYVLA